MWYKTGAFFEEICLTSVPDVYLYSGKWPFPKLICIPAQCLTVLRTDITLRNVSVLQYSYIYDYGSFVLTIQYDVLFKSLSWAMLVYVSLDQIRTLRNRASSRRFDPRFERITGLHAPPMFIVLYNIINCGAYFFHLWGTFRGIIFRQPDFSPLRMDKIYYLLFLLPVYFLILFFFVVEMIIRSY